LLQDFSEFADAELLAAEIAAQLCLELAYGPPSQWRDQGYRTLWYLYWTPHGKHRLQMLARNGTLIKDLARRAFEK